MELIEKLGLDLTLFIAQMINFLIVLGVLYVFVYKPLLTILDNRKQKIDQSLKDADRIEVQLQKSKEETQRILNEAHKEGQDIVQKASQEAQNQRTELLEQTKIEIESIMKKHEQQLAVKRDEMMQQIKEEVVDLTVYAMMNSLDKQITKDIDEKYISKVIKNV